MSTGNPVYRVQLRFQQQSTLLGGWTMNFWAQSASLDKVISDSDFLATTLSNTVGAQTVIQGSRISTVGVSRQTLKRSFNFGGTPLVASTDADYPSTALQLVLVDTGGDRVLQWIRGIPDAVVSDSGRYNPTATFTRNLNSVFNALTASGQTFVLRNLVRTTPNLVISAINPTTGVTTVPSHGYGPAGTVNYARIRGVRGLTYANKVWQFTVVDANTLQLNFWAAQTDVIEPGGKPTCTLQVYGYNKIASASIQAVSSHRTGRPTGLLGGRRKRRAS